MVLSKKDRGAVLISTLRINRSECGGGERQRRRKSGLQTGLLLAAVLKKAVAVIGRMESYRQYFMPFSRLLKVGFFITKIKTL